jgi:hypothetical protein
MKPKSKDKKIKRLENQALKLKDSKPPKCEHLLPEHHRPSKHDRCLMRIQTLRNSK